MMQSRISDNPVTIALIALGSNLTSQAGSAKANVEHALELLAGVCGLEKLKCSTLYATPAYPPGSGPEFVNAAVRVECRLSPDQLLAALHDIEATLGRVRAKRWDARIIDLDLIAFGQAVLPDPATFKHWHDLPTTAQQSQSPDALILPHPRLQDRGFVLVPLMDVAPDWWHPVLGQTIAALHAVLPESATNGIRPLAAPPVAKSGVRGK